MKAAVDMKADPMADTSRRPNDSKKNGHPEGHKSMKANAVVEPAMMSIPKTHEYLGVKTGTRNPVAGEKMTWPKVKAPNTKPYCVADRPLSSA